MNLQTFFEYIWIFSEFSYIFKNTVLEKNSELQTRSCYLNHPGNSCVWLIILLPKKKKKFKISNISIFKHMDSEKSMNSFETKEKIAWLFMENYFLTILLITIRNYYYTRFMLFNSLIRLTFQDFWLNREGLKLLSN